MLGAEWTFCNCTFPNCSGGGCTSSFVLVVVREEEGSSSVKKSCSRRRYWSELRSESLRSCNILWFEASKRETQPESLREKYCNEKIEKVLWSRFLFALTRRNESISAALCCTACYRVAPSSFTAGWTHIGVAQGTTAFVVLLLVLKGYM